MHASCQSLCHLMPALAANRQVLIRPALTQTKTRRRPTKRRMHAPERGSFFNTVCKHLKDVGTAQDTPSPSPKRGYYFADLSGAFASGLASFNSSTARSSAAS
jgi:hypothetical protein